MTLVVNLYGGPGCGKSTTAAHLFALLKLRHRNVELVTEFAKDLTWEERRIALGFQPYVIGKQMYKIHRLLGKVEVVITDSPILLGWHYAPNDAPPGFYDMVKQYHQSWDTLDVLLNRPRTAYNPEGRNQSELAAKHIDEALELILKQTETPYMTVPTDQWVCVDTIYTAISERLNWSHQ